MIILDRYLHALAMFPLLSSENTEAVAIRDDSAKWRPPH